jgi:hypothetical protein
MPNPSKRVPAYRHHKSDGRAVVTIGGRDIYLGRWNSPESRDEYDRVIAEWLASGRGRSRAELDPGGPPTDPTVSQAHRQPRRTILILKIRHRGSRCLPRRGFLSGAEGSSM